MPVLADRKKAAFPQFASVRGLPQVQLEILAWVCRAIRATFAGDARHRAPKSGIGPAYRDPPHLTAHRVSLPTRARRRARCPDLIMCDALRFA